MAASDMASAQINMTCAICREVFTSPRFLPCHHTFCLECLEQLANVHGNTIPCPTCRARATVPPGGVRALQVNFYFTDEALEQARSDETHLKCPVHTKEHVLFYCAQCDQAICLRCKLTKHDGHVTEDLSEAASRSKQTIKQELHRLEDSIDHVTNKLECLKGNEKRAREKRNGISKQIQVRFDFIVAMAQEYRDQAQQQLEEISDSLEKEMAADTQRVQGELNSLLQLKNHTRLTLTSACDTEVLQVEKEITKGEGSSERLKELEDGLPDTYFCPGLHGDFNNDIKEDIKWFIGIPVILNFPIVQNVDMDCLDQCDDSECNEVHALRQREDTTFDVIYGGTGGDFSNEKHMTWGSAGSKVMINTYKMRVTYVTRKSYLWQWKDSENRAFGSKSISMFGMVQNCPKGLCYISRMELKWENGKETCNFGDYLLFPGVQKIHNFDANLPGSFFAVVDEEEHQHGDENSSHEAIISKNGQENGYRVVRLYSRKSNDPIATYKSPKQPFFPTDVCFYDEKLLLIADWMNDSVHVTKVTTTGLTFVDYLPGSGNIVRPTALNLDLNGRLLIGCGDGLVLKYPGDISEMY
ncbi:uncharacterized protein LOC112557321 [Pomacea canaliculata]|uniref:uncharacterized protein LOC112557321 n=1 Tax=Pomacea canaliculata TaxID=400727 RepID=UPI000D738BFD|nr:uncharacterized protein LOC112557321 [Pomacea canaliculata]XP_025082889.1 uncharacterized protein LOC112557321 [Pomacea canaliculata]XP_025082890.1 uncharacterized protein LOC112557321 [Pomacea canaliculata]XP_025082891.1 uncharacterized protein LOC112557321 [Pomacea canaliculata]XP_025082892.1 uncharacterized protein LOC112557321 [Pomacea canaliculata]